MTPRDRISKPEPGWAFCFWRFIFSINIARSGTWGTRTAYGAMRTELVSLCFISSGTGRLFSVTVGPIKITFGADI